MKTKSLLAIVSVFAASLTFMNCASGESKEKEIKVIEVKGENEETLMGHFIKRFFDQNPEMFNNAVTEEKSLLELKKQFGEKVDSGVLDNMIFMCLSVEKDIRTEKLEALFSTTVKQKDSLYTVTAFVKSNVNDSMATKLKVGENYKLSGKINYEKGGTGGLYVDLKKEIRSINKKNVECPDIAFHRLYIDLKGVSLVNQ